MNALDLGDRSALISDDGAYRYELVRRWGSGPTALWIMLNPSTADAEQDDPTIRRCLGFSRREGAGALVVCNLFALRTTDPKGLLSHPDPRGPENEQYVADWISRADLVLCAWGSWPKVNRLDHGLDVPGMVRSAGRIAYCLGKTKAGHPRHPLYVKSTKTLEVYWR